MTSTTAVRQPLDGNRLLDYLYTKVLPTELALSPRTSSLLPLSSYQLNIQQFSHGQSNPTYLLSVSLNNSDNNYDNKGSNSASSPSSSPIVQYVLRKKPSNNVLASAHAIDREYRIMNVLHKVSTVVVSTSFTTLSSSYLSTVTFPVPRMIAYEPSATILNSPFYLMEYVQGQIFTDPTLSHIDSISKKQEIYTAAIDTLVTLHQINPLSVGLQDYGPQVTEATIETLGYYTRQIRRLSQVSKEQAKYAPSLPYLDEVLEWFMKQAVVRDKEGLPASIIHGDYKLDNLIFTSPTISSSSVIRVKAVLDWEMSTLGHPYSDLANMCGVYYVPVAEPRKDGSNGTAATGLSGLLGATIGWHDTGIPTEEELVELYCKKMKKPYPLHGWDFYMAFWFFKYATIAQGVAARANQGVASSASARKVGAMAPLLMELCIERIKSSSR